jgi:ABC-type nitrate/sulfonate/bicarbonate transport system substrate-binding protein
MKLRCGAVPEHFFYPWKVWLNQETGKNSGWEWKEFPGGSGEMLQAMKEGKLDAAFLLTESAVLARSKGAEIDILFPWVLSPLLWGIFSGKNNPITNLEEGKSYAISRFTSGSHLMAILEAKGRGKQIKDEQWKIAGNLEGAKKMLTEGEADFFFWEKWTTKPLVDAGFFRMLDVFPGPWPAFVFCINKDWPDDSNQLSELKAVYNEVCRLAFDMKDKKGDFCLEISREYGTNPVDTLDWLQNTRWAKSTNEDMDFLAETENLMMEAGIISREVPD